MHINAPHIPPVSAQEISSYRSMHGGRIVPKHKIAHVTPLDLYNILRLRCMLVEGIDQLPRILLFHSVQMVDVSCNIQIHPVRCFVDLDKTVTPKCVICGLYAGEEVRRCQLSGMPHGVVCDVVALYELLLQLLRQVVECCPCICEGSVTAHAGRRQLVYEK